MGRRDYEDDPAAPPANSLVPAASVVVVDDDGRVLLQRRSDNGKWALPGGKMEIGESLPACAIREKRTIRWDEVTPYPAGKRYGEVSITPIFDEYGTCTNQ